MNPFLIKTAMSAASGSITPKKVLMWLLLAILCIVMLFNIPNIVAYFKQMFAPPAPDAGNSNIVDPQTGKKYDPNGNVPNFAVDLKSMARVLHDICTGWYTTDTEEETIVKQLLKISKPVYPYLKKEYSFLDGTRDLTTDLYKNLSTTRYSQISHLF